MASTGEELTGDGANIDIGNEDWANPTNITVQSDAASATVFDVSNILHAHAFDFSVLGDSDTIDGIIVRIRASENAGGTQTMRVRLADDAGSLVGDTKEQEIDGTSPATYTFGGSADAWGLSLTGADLKADLVGCGIRQLDAAPMSVYWVTIEVEYTVAATGGVGRSMPRGHGRGHRRGMMSRMRLINGLWRPANPGISLARA